MKKISKFLKITLFSILAIILTSFVFSLHAKTAKAADSGNYLELVRYYSFKNIDNWSTTTSKQNPTASGYAKTESQGYILNTPGTGLVPLYDCMDNDTTNKIDHYEYANNGCDQYSPTLKKQIGYIYKSKQPNSTAIYHCYDSNADDAFLHKGSCPTQYIDGGLQGYTLNSVPPMPVEVSGRAYDLITNLSVPADPGDGSKVDTCGSPSLLADVSSDGSFKVTKNKGDTFCVKPPKNPKVDGKHYWNAINRSLTSGNNTESYEWQVAGYNCAGADKDSTACWLDTMDKNDISPDNKYDLVYMTVPDDPQVDLTGACQDNGNVGNIVINWTKGQKVDTVDISPKNNFGLDFYHKYNLPDTGSTKAPDGFVQVPGNKNPLVFTPGANYWVRVWNGTWDGSPTPFTAPSLTGLSSCTATPSPSPSGSPSSSPSGSPSPSPSSTPSGTPVLVTIEISEDQNFNPGSAITTINDPSKFPTDSNQSIYTAFKFSNNTPGLKTFYVRYTSNQPKETDKNPIIVPKSIELVADTDTTGKITYPQITAVTCTDSGGGNVTFNITGNNFGSGAKDSDGNSHIGLVKSGDTVMTTTSAWTENPTSTSPLTTTLGGVTDTKTDIPVTVFRFDGQSAGSSCNPNKPTQISLGAGYFCPAIPNHLEPNVNLKIYEVTTSAVSQLVSEQVVNILPTGVIDWLGNVFTFIVGKQYFISVDATTDLLQYSGVFTASPTPASGTGSTQVLNVNLYTGDINAFGNTHTGDGSIDQADHSELTGQWGDNSSLTKTGDFNRDAIVNSFDWSCMRSWGYGKFDQTAPAPIPATSASISDSPAPTPTATPTATPTEQPTPTATPSPTPGAS